jgi:hypothetical protein
MQLRIKNTALTLLIIGCLQIIGGITGLGLMGYLMYYAGALTGGIVAVVADRVKPFYFFHLFW